MRCGMVAAQQGYALSSSPARHSLLSALVDPEASALSARTRSVLHGLGKAMAASRDPAGGHLGTGGDAPGALPVGRANVESLLPAAELSPLAVYEDALAEEEGEEEEEEEPVDMTLAELDEWKAQRAERLAAARSASGHARRGRPAVAAPPTAAAEDVLRMLGELSEVEVGQLVRNAGCCPGRAVEGCCAERGSRAGRCAAPGGRWRSALRRSCCAMAALRFAPPSPLLRIHFHTRLHLAPCSAAGGGAAAVQAVAEACGQGRHPADAARAASGRCGVPGASEASRRGFGAGRCLGLGW